MSHEIKRSTAGFRLNGRLVSSERVLEILIQRVGELEDDSFAMIGALQKLGADRCETCKEWKLQVDLIHAGDRCQCLQCFNPDHFASVDDDEETAIKNLTEVFKSVNRRGAHWLVRRFKRDSGGNLMPLHAEAYARARR